MDQVKVRALIMEFIGTFGLVFIGGWSVYAAAGKSGVLSAALGHGTVLGIMVYIGAVISGGQYNPAVSLALAVTGNLHPVVAVAYIIIQLLGSIFAGACISWMLPGIPAYIESPTKLGYPHLDKSATPAQGMFMELFGAFFLMFSIYAVAVHRGEQTSSGTKGVIIGGSLFFGIISFGPITGGAFNPARTFGPSLIAKEFMMKGWWIYYVGPCIGTIVAATIYEFTFNSIGHDYTSANKEDIGGFTDGMRKDD